MISLAIMTMVMVLCLASLAAAVTRCAGDNPTQSTAQTATRLDTAHVLVAKASSKAGRVASSKLEVHGLCALLLSST